MKTIFSILLALSILSCKQNQEPPTTTAQSRTQIKITTTKGPIVLELYNETPQHRDNFIKLAKENTLDSLLFHRVIENFMIQGGDVDSKYAHAQDTLGNGELGYTVPAEFHPELFHKKGALGAARDGNPKRASSSTQFYIVQGKVQNDSLLEINENRINGWLQEHYFRNDPANKAIIDAREAALDNKLMGVYKTLQDSIKTLTTNYKFPSYTIPQAHREVYKTIGGTPHLDQNYTVFGEVIEGMDIVGEIASVETNTLDRPLEDVRILQVNVIEEK